MWFFLENDIQTRAPLRSGQIDFFSLKDEQGSETYATTVSPFFLFRLTKFLV